MLHPLISKQDLSLKCSAWKAIGPSPEGFFKTNLRTPRKYCDEAVAVVVVIGCQPKLKLNHISKAEPAMESVTQNGVSGGFKKI